MRIHPAGYRSIAVILLSSLVVLIVNDWYDKSWLNILSLLLSMLGLFLAWFYRDPERASDSPEDHVVSAADGKVLQVVSLDHCSETGGGPATRVTVFMSPLNVHVNRAPIAGRVTKVQYRPGKYLMAFNEKSSEENEANLVCMENAAGQTVAFRQIAGFLARRVRCHVHEGAELKRSERYGIIKLGSRMDHFLPCEFNIKVRPGDRVVAGETVIGVPA
jgi:phosphatidylserine decarboxylase